MSPRRDSPLFRPARAVLALLLALGVSATTAAGQGEDPREAYDALAYHLSLDVDPVSKTLSGSVAMTVRVTAETLTVLQLDLGPEMAVSDVRVAGASVPFTHTDERIVATLSSPARSGQTLEAVVDYAGSPTARDSFDGFHWAQTPDGQPWINTSSQGTGAHAWWPCKASYFHPEDKPERVAMDVTVPAGLYAVSNGRLEGIDEHDDGRRTFHWRHDYPLETYTVTLNVAPYVVVEEGGLEVPGEDRTVPFIYYVLKQNLPKAALQFQQVPELVEIYSKAFGPFPFMDSKFALVETNFWGMEHSTAVAYGSSYPAWCELTGEKDEYAGRNRDFDYILIHEVAHEWWGNAVSARSWGDFWIHEGFGTYAEAVYVEHTKGRAAADEFMTRKSRRIGSTSRLYRGDDVDSGQAYAGVIYAKGAAVLHALRHYVDDDEAWWASLRAFNLRHRYGNASTEDFRAVVEEHTGRGWEGFFESWVYGEGVPMLRGVVTPVSDVGGHRLVVEVENAGSGKTLFDVPLDLSWGESGVRRSERVMVTPGSFRTELICNAEPLDVSVDHLRRIPGTHDVVVAGDAE